MAVVLAQGTVEIVPVDITDRLGNVTDLSGASPIFSVYDDTDPSPVFYYTNQAATGVLMRIDCLIDTTDGPGAITLWPKGHYNLTVGFSVGSEDVVLGPEDLYIR